MMTWTFLDTWIVIAGVLSAVSCALVGNFLVLRKMSMMGDAISHAVLPGLAAAFLITGSRGSLVMFIGAAVVGVLTALFTEWIHRFGKVDQGASMGVVFTVLFAVGLIMIVQAADRVDLDPGCVLYGAIELVPLDTMSLGGWDVPRAVVISGTVLLLNLAVILLLFKEFKLAAFDENLATALGFKSSGLHYLLMIMVAVTTVSAFETVGSILVIAMLIVPAAAALLLVSRLRAMLLVSACIAACSAVLGHVAAVSVPPLFGFSDTNTAGMMAVAAGLLFLCAVLFAPGQGVISRWRNHAALGRKVLEEDILGMLFRFQEQGVQKGGVPCSDLARALPLYAVRQVRSAARSLVRRGFLSQVGTAYALTAKGAGESGNLIRSHRLWESYLVKHLGLPADHVHASAEQLEHITDPDMAERLSVRVENDKIDPQGRAIPPKGPGD